MTLTSFKVPVSFIKLMDELITKEVYSSRGDLIRAAILDLGELSMAQEKDPKSKRWVTQTSISTFFMAD